MMRILSIGTSCVDVFPQTGIVTPGGEALNIAVNLSRFNDVEVYLMGTIGKDSYSEIIINTVKKYKINHDHLYQVHGVTANHEIYTDETGDRYFKDNDWHSGVRDTFTLSDKDKKLLSTLDGVITTIYESTLLELIEEKKNKNYILAVDFNVERSFEKWENIINKIDILFSSSNDPTMGNFMERSKNCATIFIVTLGETGSIAYHQGKKYQCDAVKVTQVIDTTGCGDCYQGVFLAQYIKTRDILLSMKAASKEAAKVLGHVGGFIND